MTQINTTTDADRIKARVRSHYTRALRRRESSPQNGCCGDRSSALVPLRDYPREDLSALSGNAISFGCGNPLVFTGLRPGDVVVDIGSGAGLDCFLAAERVGPGGRVIGIDMTAAMIERARKTAGELGRDNVEFRLGDADSMPVEDGSADWVMSNCVINLAPDKKRVFREAYRVLRPGGQLSVSDIVADIPQLLRLRSSYASCLSGALPEPEYLRAIREAGFEKVQVVNRQRYDVEQVAALIGKKGLPGRVLFWAAHRPALRRVVDWLFHRVASVHITAIKPSSVEVAA